MSEKCCICSKPVLVSSDKPPNGLLRFHTDAVRGLKFAWHVSCEEPGWPHLR